MDLEKPNFTIISKPDFNGENEVLSVKIPSELKAFLSEHARERKRKVSELVEFILIQYALQVKSMSAKKKAK